MLQIKAFCDVDDALVVWKAAADIPDCLGFMIERRLNGGSPVVLKNYVGFPGDGAGPRPSSKWPFQRWKWTDHFVSDGDRVAFRVTAMIGKPHDLKRGEVSGWTDELGVRAGERIGAHFNRGILASQWVSRLLGEDTVKNHPGKLNDAVKTKGDPIREALSGELRVTLLKILDDAKAAGDDVYVALFELSDPELIERLVKLGTRAHVVLANGTHEKPKGLPMKDENKDARDKLRGNVDLNDRMVKSGLSHNKFLVVVHNGAPRVAWTGSTNWTPGGLCNQANNGLLIRDETVAAGFLAQWNLLKEAGDLRPPSLRLKNGTPRQFQLGPAHRPVTIWFTPLTGRADLTAATKLIDGAKQAVLFLMFNPGPTDTLFTAIQARVAREHDNPPPGGPAYIRGVINQDPGTRKKPVLMYDERGLVPRGLEVVLPAAIDDPFARWKEELLKAPSAHAMIHSKVIVLDPLGSRPIVMTGSHNFGPAASGRNDDNLVIIEGDADLAAAYMVNILQAYGNYRWRENRSRHRPATFTDLSEYDTWQHWALHGDGVAETRFWWA
jgi:phosphatidylserine/phosphatidylglycerophosphate/cardiolipin synthase-like enzyme